MIIRLLSSKNYGTKNSNYGDCIIIENNNEMIVFDCGCEEHANRVIEAMDKKGIKKVKCVLSHNDSDHFNGLLTLKDKKKIDCVYTICALKHVDDISNVDNGDDSKKSEIKKKIMDKFDNIKQLSGSLVDIYDSHNKIVQEELIPGVKIVAPEYWYAIETIARAINANESDTKDGDSVMNAASVCLMIENSKHKMLLTGDSSFANIEPFLEGLDYVQAPHHGRESQLCDLKKYFDAKKMEVVFLISDNTSADTDSGFDARHLKGRIFRCTKDGDIEIKMYKEVSKPVGTLGVSLNEMLYKVKRKRRY